MRPILVLVTVVMLMVGLSTLPNTDASQPEKTLVLRVRSAGTSKPATFSGTIQFDTSPALIQLNNESTPFGIKAKATSVKATFQKVSGEAELLVEVIEFKDEKEVGSITKTGISFEVDADGSDGRRSFSIR